MCATHANHFRLKCTFLKLSVPRTRFKRHHLRALTVYPARATQKHNASQIVCLLYSSSSRSCICIDTDLLLTRLKEIPSKPSSIYLRNKLWPFDTQAQPLPVKRTLSQKCPNVFLLLVRTTQSFTCVNSSEKDGRSLEPLFVH